MFNVNLFSVTVFLVTTLFCWPLFLLFPGSLFRKQDNTDQSFILNINVCVDFSCYSELLITFNVVLRREEASVVRGRRLLTVEKIVMCRTQFRTSN